MSDSKKTKKTKKDPLNQTELLERAERIGKLGHWHVDLENNDVFWSKEIYRIHGVAADTYSPDLESAVNFYHEDDRAIVSHALEKSIQENSDFTFDARIVRPSGEVRFVRSYGECSTNEAGEVDSVFGIFQDITEQYDLMHKLQQSEEHYKLAAEGANIGLWDWNVETGETYFNEQWYTILDYEPYELPPSFETFEALCHPDDFSQAVEILNKHMAGEADQYAIIMRMRNKSGNWVNVLTTGQAMERNEEGQATRVCGIHMDMTERVESEEALKQANLELEEFAYRTSHDLRSPLVSSIGLLTIARQALESDDKDKALKSLDLITNSLFKLEVLIKDILALTQTKNSEEEVSEINLEQLADSALEKFSYMDNFERLKVEKSFRHKNTLFLKRTRINLILENMLSNAIKYQDADEQNSFIHLSSYEERGSFVLKVEDNGLGIPEEQTEKMFKMFKRFHTRVAFGSGLGLYMMKKSAEVLGGKITYERPAKGTIFKFTIPLKDVVR